MSDVCTDCGNEYQMIAGHWTQTSCTPPSISDFQWEVLTGILMGDGNVRQVDGGRNPHMRCSNIQKEYLEHVDSLFPFLGNGVTHRYTSEDMQSFESSTGESYNDVYCWSIKSVPELRRLYSWYESGEKVFPSDLTMTPATLKHWYVCDGYLSKSHRHISIKAVKEKDNRHKIISYFEDADLPIPKMHDGKIRWTKSQSEELIAYMGDSVPGFSYKWPTMSNS